MSLLGCFLRICCRNCTKEQGQSWATGQGPLWLLEPSEGAFGSVFSWCPILYEDSRNFIHSTCKHNRYSIPFLVCDWLMSNVFCSAEWPRAQYYHQTKQRQTPNLAFKVIKYFESRKPTERNYLEGLKPSLNTCWNLLYYNLSKKTWFFEKHLILPTFVLLSPKKYKKINPGERFVAVTLCTWGNHWSFNPSTHTPRLSNLSEWNQLFLDQPWRMRYVQSTLRNWVGTDQKGCIPCHESLSANTFWVVTHKNTPFLCGVSY